MSDVFGSFKASFVELEPQIDAPTPPLGKVRLWVNNSDGNIYGIDAAGNNIQMTQEGSVATGNAQYIWDWFYNGTLSTIVNFSVVRLISGGVNDGKLALSDSDEITEDSFLGITYDGDIAAGERGKVIFCGKVPGAVAGRGYNSNTTIYMSAVPGVWTHIIPDFRTNAIFKLGFTKGDDLFIRPALISDLGD